MKTSSVFSYDCRYVMLTFFINAARVVAFVLNILTSFQFKFLFTY